MFKHYLTYQFALRFEATCRTASPDIPIPLQSELLRCARAMLDHFSRALQATDPKEISRCMFVSLTYLRDCRETLAQAGLAPSEEFQSSFDVLQARLERICLEVCKSEGGQLRMLG